MIWFRDDPYSVARREVRRAATSASRPGHSDRPTCLQALHLRRARHHEAVEPVGDDAQSGKDQQRHSVRLRAQRLERSVESGGLAGFGTVDRKKNQNADCSDGQALGDVTRRFPSRRTKLLGVPFRSSRKFWLAPLVHVVHTNGDDRDPADHQCDSSKRVLHQTRRDPRTLTAAGLPATAGESECSESKTEIDERNAQSLCAVEELFLLVVRGRRRRASQRSFGQSPQRHGKEGHDADPQSEDTPWLSCQLGHRTRLVRRPGSTESKADRDISDQQMNHTADDESGTGKALEDIVLCDVSRPWTRRSSGRAVTILYSS